MDYEAKLEEIAQKIRAIDYDDLRAALDAGKEK